jgi:hypothetical protein
MQHRVNKAFSALALIALSNCGGETDADPNSPAGGTGGSGVVAGSGGSSADAGSSGSAGASGSGAAGGSGGAGGSSGRGGSGGKSGSGGSGGSGGSSGSGGKSGSGSGAAGSGGAGSPNDFGDPPIASDLLCGERPGKKASDTNVLRFESEDGSTVVQIRRVLDGAGAGESSIYHIESFAVVRDGETTCLEGEALSYTNSHHNWTDVAEAEGDGVNYRLEFMFGTTLTYTLVAVAGDSTLFQEPLLVTGAPAFCWSCPASVRIAISELMLNNVTTLPDEQGEFEPWIELYNPSSEAVDLSGYTLSNDFGDRTRWSLPAMTLPGLEVLTIFADGEPEEGPLHSDFRLSAEGGEIVLTRPDAQTDGGFVFGSMPADASLEFAWEAGDYARTREPTPNAPPAE